MQTRQLICQYCAGPGACMELVWHPGSAISSYVEQFWYSATEHAGSFTSVATTNWELVFAIANGKRTIVARGPETRASQATFPAGAEFFGITFKLGAFMPGLPVRTLLDRQDLLLPQASQRSFWLHGCTWELPTFDNVDVFASRLIRQEILLRDPLVEAALHGKLPALSARSLQYRFVQATGLSHKTIQQIERAQRAVALLQQGTPIIETACELGYFDQAHLTNALRRFVGKTPAQIAAQRLLAC